MVGGVASESDSGKGGVEWREKSRNEVRKGEDFGIGGSGLNEVDLEGEFCRLATGLEHGFFALS
jgi:hypothetical protein